MAAIRLIALLFTDLVDSTRQNFELGDLDYARFVREPHDRIFRELLRRFAGAEEVDCAGDGFFATFATVHDAVNFALAFHEALRTHGWERTPPQIRMGVHVGDVVEVEGKDGATRVAGSAANVCARVMGLGLPGQTLLTRAAFDMARPCVRCHPADWETGAPSPHSLQWKVHGPYRFKGSDEPTEVCEVGAVGLAPLRTPPDSEKAKRAGEQELSIGGRVDQPIDAEPRGIDVPAPPCETMDEKLLRELSARGVGEDLRRLLQLKLGALGVHSQRVAPLTPPCRRRSGRSSRDHHRG